MSLFWQVPAVLITLMSWMAEPPVSLTEAAHKEALRRRLVGKSVNSFTNQDLPPSALVLSVPPDEVASPPATTISTPVPPPPTRPEAAPVQTPPRDEQWWRDRVAATRTALERNQVLADAMQARINSLQTDVVNRDDPAQRDQLRRQLQRALDEHDRLKQQMARDQQSLKDIQTEARRNSIPPGWIR